MSASPSASSSSRWWLSPAFTHSLVALSAAATTYALLAFKHSVTAKIKPISTLPLSSPTSANPALDDDPDEEEWFREKAVDLINFTVQYRRRLKDDIHVDLPIRSRVSPGYLAKLVPACAPEEPENWEQIKQDLEQIIVPGITHWQSPHFYGYYPAYASYPSFLGDMLSTAFNVIGFNWIASPALTELEALTTDWLAKLMGLPYEFLSSSGKGGGAIHGAAGEAVIVALLAAKHRALHKYEGEEADNRLSKLVAYVSDQTHGICIKGCKVIGIPLRNLRTIRTQRQNKFELNPKDVQNAIEADIAAGLIPFFCCLTFGTTSSSAIDPIPILAPLCQRFDIFVHIDAAYGGSFLILPEYQQLLADGLSHVDSFSLNPHKTLFTAMDCAILYVRDRFHLTNALRTTDMEFLRNKASSEGSVVDLKDWGITFGRRFRSLKLWMVMRCYGAEGLRKRLKKTIQTAISVEGWIKEDERFEMSAERLFSLVCFRLKLPTQIINRLAASSSSTSASLSYSTSSDLVSLSNQLNKSLVESLNASGKLFLIDTVLDGEVTIRLATSPLTTPEVIKRDWRVIQDEATNVLDKFKAQLQNK